MGRAWRWLDALYDGFVVSFALTDIVTDVAVAVEFYERGEWTFFAISSSIFLLAQLSYAFLFVAAFAPHWSTSRRVLLFFAVLPLAQLVPFFAWLESFHVRHVDGCLLRCGMKPSANPATAEDGGTVEFYLHQRYAAGSALLPSGFVVKSTCVVRTASDGRIASIEERWNGAPLLDYSAFRWVRRANGLVSAILTPILT